MLSSASGRPSRMSQLMSIPGASLMSQLIQVAEGSVPEPQFKRLISASAMSSHRPQLLDQATEDPPGVEMLRGDIARRAGVALALGLHGFDRGRCVVGGR